MVALNEQFHHNCAKSRGSYRRKDGSGRHGKSPTASVSSVNSVACNHPDGGLSGTIPNGTTDYIWQGWQTVEERNPFGGSGSTDTPTKQYVWGTYIDECIQLNLLVAAGPQGLAVGNYYLLQDLLYRAVALTNSSGFIEEVYDTDAYGNTLIFTTPGPDDIWFTNDDWQSDYGANEIIYCGYRFDPETQLYYVRNRTYNPVLGRWIQRDPIGYSGGINLYEYAGGLPAAASDSFGQQYAPPLPIELPPPVIAFLLANAELLAAIAVLGVYLFWRYEVCMPGYRNCIARADAWSSDCAYDNPINGALSLKDKNGCAFKHLVTAETKCAGNLILCFLAFWSGFSQPDFGKCFPCPSSNPVRCQPRTNRD